MITFKLILTKAYENEKDDFLIKENWDFFSVSPKSATNYSAELKEALHKEFGVKLMPARSFWVENTPQELRIYTIVGCPRTIEKPGYKWVNRDSLVPKDFDEYDEVAVGKLLARYTTYH